MTTGEAALVGGAAAAVTMALLFSLLHYYTVVNFILLVLTGDRDGGRPWGWVSSARLFACSSVSWQVLRKLERRGIIERLELPGGSDRGYRPRVFFRLKLLDGRPS